MEPLTHPIKTSFERGAANGWQGFLWMSKIILPVCFATFFAGFFAIIFAGLDFGFCAMVLSPASF